MLLFLSLLALPSVCRATAGALAAQAAAAAGSSLRARSRVADGLAAVPAVPLAAGLQPAAVVAHLIPRYSSSFQSGAGSSWGFAQACAFGGLALGKSVGSRHRPRGRRARRGAASTAVVAAPVKAAAATALERERDVLGFSSDEERGFQLHPDADLVWRQVEEHFSQAGGGGSSSSRWPPPGAQQRRRQSGTVPPMPVPPGDFQQPWQAGYADAGSEAAWMPMRPLLSGSSMLSGAVVSTISSSTEPMSCTPLSSLSGTSTAGLEVKARCSKEEAEGIISALRSGESALQRAVALARVLDMAWPLALSKHGCRVVQAALGVADAAGQLAVAHAIMGHVEEAVRSPHGNHVLQKLVEVLPPDAVAFIARELSGRARVLATHQYGCRVLERLFEHLPAKLTTGLATELLWDAQELARDQYGNFVLQCLLEHSEGAQLREVARSVIPHARSLARNKHGSNVVQKVMVHCVEERRWLFAVLADGPEELAALEGSRYGSFVAKEMRRLQSLDTVAPPC